MHSSSLPHPWQPGDLAALQSVDQFAHLVPITLGALKRLGGQVTLLSGPISTGGKGSREANLAVFVKAIEFVSGQGDLVFSQMPTEGVLARLAKAWQEQGNTGYCMPILDDFYSPLFRSGLVRRVKLIPGWQSSVGAQWEVSLCSNLGIEVVPMPFDWETQSLLPLTA